LFRLLAKAPRVRQMSGATVKVYVPTPAEQKYPVEALRSQFFNLPLQHVDFAGYQAKMGSSAAKNAKLYAQMGEEFAEKLAYYKPSVFPTQNQSSMSVKQVKELLNGNKTVISAEEKAKTLAAVANKADSDMVIVENTKFGQPLVKHFVQELALYISRGSIVAGNPDPLAFMKSLYSKDFPANLGETLVMDTLVGLHGKTRDISVPFHQQIKTETMAKVEKHVAPLFASPTWAKEVSQYMFEVAAVPLDDQRPLQNDDMYSMFWVGAPILALIIIVAFWEEISHVRHARHEQHERVDALLKEKH